MPTARRPPASPAPAVVHPAAAAASLERRSQRCRASSVVTYATGSAASTRTRATAVQLRRRARLPGRSTRSTAAARPSARRSTRRAPAPLVGDALAQAVRLEDRRQDPDAVRRSFPTSRAARTGRSTLVGIFDASGQEDRRLLSTRCCSCNWKYFDEATPYNSGAGRLVRHRAGRRQPGRRRSPRRSTRCRQLRPRDQDPDRAGVQAPAFIKQIGDIGLIVGCDHGRGVLHAAAAGSATPWRRRCASASRELAVLKTIGFSDGSVLGVVLAESIAAARCSAA